MPGTPALGRQVEGLLGLAGQLVQWNRLAPDSVRDCLTKWKEDGSEGESISKHGDQSSDP